MDKSARGRSTYFPRSHALLSSVLDLLSQGSVTSVHLHLHAAVHQGLPRLTQFSADGLTASKPSGKALQIMLHISLLCAHHCSSAESV